MDVPDIAALRARRTRKWTVYPEDVLPAWIAESDFATCPPVKRAIREAVERESFGYTPAHSDLPAALADFYQRRYGWRPDPEGVVTVPDVVRGLTLAAQHLTRPGSAVVLPVPAYPPFLEIPTVAGRERVLVDTLDLDQIEDAFRAGAGSLLLCSPNNPLGFVPERATLEALVALAERYDARLLVDEIHAPLVYGQRPHAVTAALSEAAARVCVTVTATSKAWNIAGLKCAQLILSNPKDRKAWAGLPGVAKDGTSTLGIFAAAACYREGYEFLEAECAQLAENRDVLVSELPERVPGLRTTAPEATYLLWLDFTQTPLAADPAGFLLRHGRVALNDGRAFGPGGEGHARLNFATSRENLKEIVSRIERAAAAAR